MSNKSTHESPLVPKFGEWNVNDPSANGYSRIFNQLRDEKKDGTIQSSPKNSASNAQKRKAILGKLLSKKWFCCCRNGHSESR